MFTVKNYRLGAACARACRIRSLIRQCRAGFVHRWLIAMLAMLFWPPGALAQVPAPGVDSQFDIIGFIQEATLDSCIATDAFCGGQIKVNGHTIIVPRNLIVILPANALTWAELFSQSPVPYTGKFTGMALTDVPLPLTTYEVHVTGNQVNDVFTAGLIDIAQQSVNAGAGFINYIDYTTGEMRVGGQIMRVGGLPANLLSTVNKGARVRLNDPKGGFGRIMTVDSRMTLDPDNPTVRSKTGFPMCVPRTDPKTSDDPKCPQRNRPKDPPLTGPFSTNFTMNLPVTTGQDLDPRLMAPFEVGDYVSYAGTLASDAGGTASTGPFPVAESTYISAHTVTGNLAIYTQPGSNPAYVAIDTSLLGNGGVIELANLEATVRTRFEGFTTDPSRDIQLFAIDYAPTTGIATDRLWGIVGVDPGPPNGAVKGRWRFRPPCTGVTATFRFCFGPLDETTFLPAPREVRAAVGGTWITPRVETELNGLIAGQYHAPIAEYLFAENLAGTTPPPINFGSLPFLAKGGYSSSIGKGPAGPLSPFPGSAPIVACTPPTASAGSNFSVASGTKGVVLNGTATGSGTLTYLWTPPVAITLAPSATVLTPTFDAPVFTTASTGNTYPFTLKVSGCNGLTASSTVTVNVTAPITGTPPVVNAIASQTVTSGKPVSFTAIASGGSAPLTYNWTQSSGVPQPFSLGADPATIQFTHSLASNQVTNDVLVYTVVVSDSTKAVSAPATATVTYTPVPDVETMTAATYSIGKQKLTLSVTSSVINPALTLKLMPYLTTGGSNFDPVTTGNTFVTNGTNGVYSLTLSGVPEPAASVTVKSSIGGSTTFSLTRVR